MKGRGSCLKEKEGERGDRERERPVQDRDKGKRSEGNLFGHCKRASILWARRFAQRMANISATTSLWTPLFSAMISKN